MNKSKFSNCNLCPLKDQEMVVGETNVPNELKKVKLLVLAEAPATTEVDFGRPLMGKAGKIFRRIFESSGLEELPHYIGNVVFCANLYIDDKTGNRKTRNPPKKAIEQCKPNWETLIKITEPDYILALGNTVKNVFNIGGSMGDTRGRLFDYVDTEGINTNTKIFVTYHPSFIGRGTATLADKKNFEDDFRLLYSTITGNEYNKNENKKINRAKLKLKKPFYYSIPSWMKNDDIMLFDIQNIPGTKDVIYIFKDKDGNRKYHKDKSGQYYYYKAVGKLEDALVLNKISEVELIQEQSPGRTQDALYEADVKLTMKHSIDYYLQRKKPELIVPLKKLFFDIEVYSEGDKNFPDPKLAKKPVNAISFKFGNEKTSVYVVNPKSLVKNKELAIDFKEDMLSDIDLDLDIKIFKDEKSLLIAFAKKVSKLVPDIFSGWNSVMFDIPTIYNRMKRLGINTNLLSPLGYTFVNPHKYGEVTILGTYPLDFLELFRTLTEGGRESYKLGAIAKTELGEGKVEFEGSLDELYEKDIKKFIKYSAQDTNLLYELDEKLGHIELKNEMKKVCRTTWKGTESTTGLLDPLLLSYAKERGMVIRNSEMLPKEKYPGAYVITPLSGLYSWIIDFDYKGLYPSIVISCNIGPETFIGKIDPEIAKKFIYRKDELPHTIDVIINPMVPEKSFITKHMLKDDFTEWINDNEGIVTIAGTIFMGHSKKLSMVAEVNNSLVELRDVFKTKMKESRKDNDPIWELYYNKQWAYKILANSIYGFIGLNSSRFYKLDLAKSITLTGQELLKFAGSHLPEYMDTGNTDIDPMFLDKFETDRKKYLIYGDTDSIFLNISEYLMDKNML